MQLTEDELQIARRPQELREFVRTAVSRAKNEKSEHAAALLKSGPYKKFRDEITPLALCATHLFDASVRIKPNLGNEGYDAEILDDGGKVVGKIEISAPHDGALDADDARRAVRDGRSARMFNDDNLTALRQQLLKACEKKAKKDYGDCTLIVAMNWIEMMLLEEDEAHDFRVAPGGRHPRIGYKRQAGGLV